MPAILPIVAFANHYGRGAAVVLLVSIKFAKYKAVTWRKDRVNGKVREIVNTRFQLGAVEDAYDRCAPGAADGSHQRCAACDGPLLSKHAEQEDLVWLSTCGCIVHAKCLYEAATGQHGIDCTISDGWAAIGRFFGVVSIAVEDLCCPCCHTSNTSWQILVSPGSPLHPAELSARNDRLDLDALCRSTSLTLRAVQNVFDNAFSARPWNLVDHAVVLESGRTRDETRTPAVDYEGIINCLDRRGTYRKRVAVYGIDEHAPRSECVSLVGDIATFSEFLLPSDAGKDLLSPRWTARTECAASASGVFRIKVKAHALQPREGAAASISPSCSVQFI